MEVETVNNFVLLRRRCRRDILYLECSLDNGVGRFSVVDVIALSSGHSVMGSEQIFDLETLDVVRHANVEIVACHPVLHVRTPVAGADCDTCHGWVGNMLIHDVLRDRRRYDNNNIVVGMIGISVKPKTVVYLAQMRVDAYPVRGNVQSTVCILEQIE